MSHITVVAQTPFHLFCSLLIAKFSQVPCDLWLIDRTLTHYLQPCRDSGIWRDVYYAEKSGENLWASTISSRFERSRAFFRSRKKIKNYLKNNSPRAIFIFSDNHELTAYFAEHRKSHPETDLVLVEEGATVYFAPDRIRAPRWKGICRWLLGIPNPWGYSIGWSPQINKLLLSDPEKAHPMFVKDRLCVKWPEGPFPETVIDDFVSLIGGVICMPPADDVDFVYIGTPLFESGLVTKEEERHIVETFLSNTSYGNVWIKPHPFDTPGKYENIRHAKFFPAELNNVPAEVFFHYLKPRLVLAPYFSSAMINYCTRYSRCAIFYLPPKTSPVLRQGIKQNFLDIPRLRLVEDLSEIPTVMHEFLLANAAAGFPDEASVASWRQALARALE